jgi:hypothetical protein
MYTIRNPKELCIECGRNKPSNDESWFCESCRKKIIDYCRNYHNKLQESYR